MLASSPISLLSPRDFWSHSPANRLVIFALIFIFVISWSKILHGHVNPIHHFHASTDPISNSTLGFQKIYALALPGREDRTKPLLDAAKATNLSITMLNAVKDADISMDSWPKEWNEGSHNVGELGCLVSHLRTWNKMISGNVSSALILESDADWDMRIKEIMHPLATGIKTIVDWPFNEPHHTQDPRQTPYGDSWDIVWMGHCGSSHEGYGRIYSWNDTTVPPENKEYTFDIGLLGNQHIPGTRAVYQFGRTTCSTAYAVSLQGAIKLVQYFETANENLDLQLSSYCSRHSDMTCLGVWPQIITGAPTKSNIQHAGNGDVAGGGDDSKEVAAGPALQFSARSNAKMVLEDGLGMDEWIAQWDTSWGVKNGTWDLVELNRTMI